MVPPSPPPPSPLPPPRYHLSTTPSPLPPSRYPLPVTPFPFPPPRFPLPVTLFPLPLLRYPLSVTLSPLPSPRYPLPVTSTPLPPLRYPLPITPSPLPPPRYLHPITPSPLPSSKIEQQLFLHDFAVGSTIDLRLPGRHGQFFCFILHKSLIVITFPSSCKHSNVLLTYCVCILILDQLSFYITFNTVRNKRFCIPSKSYSKLFEYTRIY